MRKLIEVGPALSAPHSSAVLGARSLRELRPRAGRSRWRALYRRSGATFWVGAIAPEARVDPLRFRRGVRTAELRLDALEGTRR